MHTYIHICVCISDAPLQKLPRPSSSWWGVKPLGSLGPGWAGNFSFPATGQSTTYHQILLLVPIIWINHWAFIHPPHKNYFAFCQLFPGALGCPLNILCAWHRFTQDKHAPQACGLYFFQGFRAAITY